jgi:putative heme-binding domain-containing protein
MMARLAHFVVLASAVVFVCLDVRPAAAQGAVAPLRRLLESGRVLPERQGTILEMICTRGEADDLAVPFKMLVEPGKLEPKTRLKVAELLTDAAVTRRVKPSGDLSPLAALIEGPEAAKDRRLQTAATRLAAAWKLAEIAPALEQIAKSDDASDSLRQAALEGLVSIGGKQARRTIESLSSGGKSVAIRALATAALARLDVQAASAAAADVLKRVGAEDDVGPMLDAILSRREGADALAAALEKTPIPADAAKLALRHVYSIGRSDARLSNVLSQAAGIALDAPPPSPAEATKIAALVAERGNAERGERIFRRNDVNCLKCHSVAGAGGSVGPELSAVGSISPIDYIVNSILNPNLAIKEQYVTRRVLTTDGELITGIQIDRDDQRLRLRDATGKAVEIPTADIEQEGEGSSLMPQGLTKFLTEQEFLDLSRFVSELGKPGPYAIRRAATIQRWRVLKSPGMELTAEVPNVEVFREQVLDAPADQWMPAYGTVGGWLPLADVAKGPAVLYVQGEFDVSEAGPLAVDIDCTEPTQCWLDSEPFEAARHIERPLTAGRHKLTLRIPVPAAADAEPRLKVELSKPAGSAVQFAVVNGM